MKSESNETPATTIPNRIVRISLLIVLGWFGLLIKIINGLSGLMLGVIGKLLRGEKKKD